MNELAQRARAAEMERYDRRYLVLLLCCVLAFTALGFRLWQLQIVEGEKYYRASTENIIRHYEVQAPRGAILDRRGVALAENRASFDVYIEPQIFLANADDEVYQLLTDYLHLSSDQLRRVRRRAEERAGSVLVRRDVARADIARIEEDQMRLPGVEVRPSIQRRYPLHHVGAHTLGFVAEIGPSRLRELRDYGYRSGDYVGRMGLEQAFDSVLHGSPGLDRAVVDARGNPLGEADTQFLIGEYQRVQPVVGRDLVTTLDADLMVIIDEAIEDYAAGAVVAIDPRDGSVLAMYSKPHFNPNAWSGRLSRMEKLRSDNDPFNPMMNKAINSYFPGSVYKVVGSWAALAEGIFEPEDTSFCRGFHMFGGHRFRCWRDHGHGHVDAYSAMAQSCDVYYYEAAEQIDMDVLADYGQRFGFGERSGLVIRGERAGRVPTRQWHQEHSPEGYQRGFDLNTILGQGDTHVTPLQVALAYAAIANGGDLYYPRLVDEIRNEEGLPLFSYAPKVRKRLDIDEEHLEVLRESLRQTVHGPRGTARGSALSHTEVAGKTGTAQVARIGAVRVDHADRELRRRNHAWFAAFAPYDEPEIALVVFLEHGGGGGGDAAPVAMEILDRYLSRTDLSALSVRLGEEYRGEQIRDADDEEGS